jgi:hypothetical protein
MADNSYQKLADNAKLKAWHQVMTVVGLPAVMAISSFAGLQLWEINKTIARFEDIPRRVEVLEKFKDDQYVQLIQRPRFDKSDGEALEKRVTVRIDRNSERITRNAEAITANMRRN